MFTGHPEQVLKLKPDHPDLMCVAHEVRSGASRRVPIYVGVNPIPYLGSAYLRPAYEPFGVFGDPNLPGFKVSKISHTDTSEVARLNGRMSFAERFDELRRAIDDREKSDTLEAFQRQAFALLTSPEARRAFDLGREDPRVRDRYGRNTWGQRCLLARRLVEAGVDLVTTSLDGPLCGRVGNWDDHAVNHIIFDAMMERCRYFDQAVSALIEDIHSRGLDRRVLVVVTGEFGGTPRISYAKDSASGVTQPGRDHWPRGLAAVKRRRHPRWPGDRSHRPPRGRSDEPAGGRARLPGHGLPPLGHRRGAHRAPGQDRATSSRASRGPTDPRARPDPIARVARKDPSIKTS
jgi:hypothetical protein